MSDGSWELVFDASQKFGERFAFLGAFAVALVAFVAIFVIAAREVRNRTGSNARARGIYAFLTVAVSVLVLFTAALWFGGPRGPDELARAVDESPVVEGTVENFHPMPYTGHDEETFDVKGVHFAYSDYGVTQGFNNTSSHGGPVRAGLYVRIHYAYVGSSRDATIMRLEIRR